MSTITTTRKVNPGQLSYEVGRYPTRVRGPYEDGTTVVTVDGVGEANLVSAVEAHAPMENWTDPDYVAPPPTEAEVEDTQTRDQMLAIRTKAKAVFAGTDTFTAAQLQKIAAALVLRATR